jgi:outer membrane immunogenic protein
MTKRLTSLLATTTFIIAASASAFAADIAVKAPLPAPAPVYSWTGWYVGGNAGAGFGHATTDFNAAPVTVTSAGSDTQYPSGFTGGGQIGYNWQYSPLIVVGLEADFQGAAESDSDNLSQPFHLGAVTGTALTNYTTKIDWFGTVRGRIGYVWGNGQLLSYVTGGLAYGEVNLEGTNTVVTGATFGHSQVNTGWVVGYGTEGHLPGNWIPGNWTWKIEGLYMDLGSLDTAVATAGELVTTHTHFTNGTLRAGLNYQFH